MYYWVMGTTIWDYIGNYYRDPFPHSLLRTRQKMCGCNKASGRSYSPKDHGAGVPAVKQEEMDTKDTAASIEFIWHIETCLMLPRILAE